MSLVFVFGVDRKRVLRFLVFTTDLDWKLEHHYFDDKEGLVTLVIID